MLETWRRADETDFIEGAWLFDHFYPIFGDTDGPCMEAWTTLSALTPRILSLPLYPELPPEDVVFVADVLLT